MKSARETNTDFEIEFDAKDSLQNCSSDEWTIYGSNNIECYCGQAEENTFVKPEDCAL